MTAPLGIRTLEDIDLMVRVLNHAEKPEAVRRIEGEHNACMNELDYARAEVNRLMNTLSGIEERMLNACRNFEKPSRRKGSTP